MVNFHWVRNNYDNTNNIDLSVLYTHLEKCLSSDAQDYKYWKSKTLYKCWLSKNKAKPRQWIFNTLFKCRYISWIPQKLSQIAVLNALQLCTYGILASLMNLLSTNFLAYKSISRCFLSIRLNYFDLVNFLSFGDLWEDSETLELFVYSLVLKNNMISFFIPVNLLCFFFSHLKLVKLYNHVNWIFN